MHRNFSGVKKLDNCSCNLIAFGVACLAESVNRCSVGGYGMAGKPVGTENAAPDPPRRVSVFLSYPPRDFLSPSGVSFFSRVSRRFRHAATACRFGQLALRP
jgi:hypothetical protein